MLSVKPDKIDDQINKAWVAKVRVHAKFILKSVCNVRACGSFSGMRCAITLLHTLRNKMAQKKLFFVVNKNYSIFPILF